MIFKCFWSIVWLSYKWYISFGLCCMHPTCNTLKLYLYFVAGCCWYGRVFALVFFLISVQENPFGTCAAMDCWFAVWSDVCSVRLRCSRFNCKGCGAQSWSVVYLADFNSAVSIGFFFAFCFRMSFSYFNTRGVSPGGCFFLYGSLRCFWVGIFCMVDLLASVFCWYIDRDDSLVRVGVRIPWESEFFSEGTSFRCCANCADYDFWLFVCCTVSDETDIILKGLGLVAHVGSDFCLWELPE